MSNQVTMAIVGYVIGINLLAYAAMALDKAKAENGLRRIPEATLLNLAMLGGSLGTVVAQQTIRHKTRKEPFRSRLVGIVLLQVVALIAAALGVAMTGSPEALRKLLTS